MKRWMIIGMSAVFLLAGSFACLAAEPLPQVKLTTSMGEIVVALNLAAAPATVSNFLTHVKDGYYDGTIFHRVIAGFMIQGGGFTIGMQRKKSRPPIRNEADNGLSNRTGTIAMARTSDPHSASTQFFINAQDNVFLDHRAKTVNGWGYCVFGRVVEGLHVVRAIENVPTTARSGMRDVPRTPVIIERALIVPAGTTGKKER